MERSFLRRRLDPAARYGLRATLFGLAVALVGIPFGLLTAQVSNGGLGRLDASVATSFRGWLLERPGAVSLVRVVTDLGSTPVYVVLCTAVVLVLLRQRHHRLAAFVVVTSVGSGTINALVKAAVGRARPSLEPLVQAEGFSYPSGHAMSSVVIYGALLLVALPAVRARGRPYAIGGWVALALAIGASRLALGVHYVTDVLGGYVLGLAWLAASTAAFSVWRVERGLGRVHPTRGLEPDDRVAD